MPTLTEARQIWNEAQHAYDTAKRDKAQAYTAYTEAQRQRDSREALQIAAAQWYDAQAAYDAAKIMKRDAYAAFQEAQRDDRYQRSDVMARRYQQKRPEGQSTPPETAEERYERIINEQNEKNIREYALEEQRAKITALGPRDLRPMWQVQHEGPLPLPSVPTPEPLPPVTEAEAKARYAKERAESEQAKRDRKAKKQQHLTSDGFEIEVEE